MQYAELLYRLTVDCKDNGKRFQVKDRIREIKSLLAQSDYRLLFEGDLSLIYGKALPETDEYKVLVSSHIDCVYENCFAEEVGECWKGTFDNSATNAAVIDLMLRGELGCSVLVAFTGDEEKDDGGAIEVLQFLHEKECCPERVIVLDVTNEGEEEEVAFSMENDRNFDLLAGYQLIGLLQSEEVVWVFAHDAEPDETWVYGKATGNGFPGIPCLSLCLPVVGDMHAEAGVYLYKSKIEPYKGILSKLANCAFG